MAYFPHVNKEFNQGLVVNGLRTHMSAFSATVVMAFISSGVNCRCSSLSVGVETPPPPIILMKSAPVLICSRAALIQSGTPSQIRPKSPFAPPQHSV